MLFRTMDNYKTAGEAFLDYKEIVLLEEDQLRHDNEVFLVFISTFSL